jgi:nucleoside-diphosphate-sugar epimerase
MRVLVIGATGYLGGAVTAALLGSGHDVTALLLPSQDPAVLPPGAASVVGDLTAPPTLRAAVTDGVDAVVNLATPSGDPTVDAAATEALLAGLRGSGRAYLYTSGIWVLGATGPEPADELSPVRPIPLVGYRPSIEQQVLAAAADGVRALVVRPAIAYGRGGGIPALLVAQAVAHGAGVFVGSGSTTWPMVHVDDLADLFVAAVERGSAGATLHAVAHDAVPVRALAAAAAQAAGLPGAARSWPLAEARRELGEAFADALALSQVATGARARRVLGWEPSRPDPVTDLVAGSYRRPSAVPVGA